MKTKYDILYIPIILMFMLQSCTNSNEFLIKKGQVGRLTTTTQIKDMASLFKGDSIVVVLSKEDDLSKGKFFKEDDQYIIYQKGGKHLLTIVPVMPHDSLSKIKSVEIFDNRYKSASGVSLFSPYKDIHTAYNVGVTNTRLSSAQLDIDELNATMLIDKKEIGINDFNTNEIRPDNIPDLAKVKRFTMWFN